MNTNCKHYDAELDCCKLHSDWSEAMPVLQPCVDGPCTDCEPANEMRQILAMADDVDNALSFGKRGVVRLLITTKNLYNAGYRKQIDGEWLEQADGTHYCSNCGKDATYTYDGVEVCGVVCPYCATRMKGA